MTPPRLLLGVKGAPVPYELHTRLHGQLPRPANDGSLIGELASAALRDEGRRVSARAKARCGQTRPGPAGGGDQCVRRRANERQGPSAARISAASGALWRPVLRSSGRGNRAGIALDAISVAAGDAVEDALAERPDLHGALAPTIVEVPPGYVSGQETALVSYLNGGPALPTRSDKRVTERGIGRRPTLVCNAETLAHAGLIARHGARWFRRTGTAEEPGTALITLSGPVRDPAVYEIEYDTSLTELLDAAGGLNEPVSAFLIGGYAGTWIPVDKQRSIRLSRAGLRPFGAALGAGIVAALPEQACPVGEVAQ